MPFPAVLAVLAPLIVLPLCARSDETRLALPDDPAGWDGAVPVRTARTRILADDGRDATTLRGWRRPTPEPAERALPAITADWIAAQRAELLADTGTRTALRIDWIHGGDAPAAFTRNLVLPDGRLVTRYRLGTTTITRTLLASAADDVVFLHLLADKPGALSFRVSMPDAEDGSVRVFDRRQLRSAPEFGLAASAWVIPFESDVATEGRSIVLRGEGEALVIWKFAPPVDTAALDATWKRLGERHDPGHWPPDPIKVWSGVLAALQAPRENSP